MMENAVPEEIRVSYEKTLMAMDKKNYAYAIKLLTQIINIKPDFAKGRQLLRLAEIKNFEENPPYIIIRLMNRIFSWFAILIAMIYKTKGDHFKAMSIYEKMLYKDPKNTAIMVKLGDLLKIEGLKEASCVTLESVVNISVKNRIAYELLGEVYSDLGKYDQARFCFKKVLELKPNDANAERGLKNLDALTTIDKSFGKEDSEDFRTREITE
jgi:tetratricopeptide (TPR) repeat protein